MDDPNTAKYKYYKCRSLLACDTGGTVYDTSERCEESIYSTNLKQDRNRVVCESDQSENTFYFIDAEGNLKSEERSLVDLTTHLDDDEFNDYEMHSNQSYDREGEKKHCILNKNLIRQLNSENQIYSQLESFDCDIDDNHEEQSVQNLINQILNNGSNFAAECLESCEELNNLSNTTFSNIKCNTLIDTDECKQDKINLQHFINLPQSNLDMFEINKIGIDLNTKHIHKRKQTYNIKEDSFSDIFREGKSILSKVMAVNSKSKKKKSFDKENRKEKLQFYKKNPFGNVKMNSILKGNKKQTVIKDNDSTWQRRESVTSSNDETYEQNKNNVTDEVVVYEKNTCQIDYLSSLNSTNDIIQGISTVITLNSEFTNADYLEYVQPRERIVESDMDKLLSPTVESEISEIFQSCKRKQLIKNGHVKVDYNGNEINLQDIEIMGNSKTTLTPNEIAERELFLKSAYAKKLGYENYFNTSNDSVVNDVLFDSTIFYEEMKSDANLIKNIEIYSKENQFVDRSFQPVSCTLLESLNEFNRFGGFAEENQAQNKLSHAEENSNTMLDDDEITCNSEESKFYNKQIELAQEIQNKNEFHLNSYFNFNFSNKSSLLGLDFQSKYNNSNSLENLTVTNIDTKQSFASLKIKIKRVNDKNKYIIDDSNKHCIDIIEKKALKSVKNLDRYECYDCSAKFRTKRILKNHVSENHRGPYDTECEICHMKFRKSSAHKKHQPWCVKNVTHTCDICNKIYCYQASLIKHLKTHKHLFNENSS